MIKVICIDDNFFAPKYLKTPKIHPKEGEICTVIETKPDGYYVLLEYLYTDIASGTPKWNPKKFIPLSNIDETELIKEREVLTEKV